MLFIIIYTFLFGLIIGSFLNVVILRYNTGHSLAGRSGCFSCGESLRWYELIPVASFLAQKGKCRHCKAKISHQYPLVELFTGILFALSAWKFYPDFVSIAFYCLVFSLLVFVIVYDLKHKIIPDEPAYAFIFLSVFAPAILGFYRLPAETIGKGILWAITGGSVLFSVFFCLWFFSRGRWMGFGDAKLVFGIGALLGLRGAANAVILAFWLGAIIGLCLVALTKLNKIRFFRQHFSIKSEIPFAPFLVSGLILNLVFGIAAFTF